MRFEKELEEAIEALEIKFERAKFSDTRQRWLESKRELQTLLVRLRESESCGCVVTSLICCCKDIIERD